MRSRGMTLLEVLIAMVVFAVAGLAVINSTGEQVNGLNYLQQKMVASWVADNQLAMVILQQPWPEEGWHNGESPMAGTTWYWRWRGIQTSDEHLRGVEVEVREQPERETPLSSLLTYVLDPALTAVDQSKREQLKQGQLKTDSSQPNQAQQNP